MLLAPHGFSRGAKAGGPAFSFLQKNYGEQKEGLKLQEKGRREDFPPVILPTLSPSCSARREEGSLFPGYPFLLSSGRTGNFFPSDPFSLSSGWSAFSPAIPPFLLLWTVERGKGSLSPSNSPPSPGCAARKRGEEMSYPKQPPPTLQPGEREKGSLFPGSPLRFF